MRCEECKAKFEIKEVKASKTYKEGDNFYCVYCGDLIVIESGCEEELKKFTLRWSSEGDYEVDIIAASEEEAEDKFNNGDYDHDRIRELGDEMVENSLEIEEVEEE